MGNVKKSKIMNYQSGEIHMGMEREDFSRRVKREKDAYQERLRRLILCPDCGVELTDRYMTAHHRKLNGTEPDIDWD